MHAPPRSCAPTSRRIFRSLGCALAALLAAGAFPQPGVAQQSRLSVTILEYDGSACRQAVARARLPDGGQWWCIRGIAAHASGIAEVRVGEHPAVLVADSSGGTRFTGFVPAREGEQQVAILLRATDGTTADELYQVASAARDPARPDQRTFVLTNLRPRLAGQDTDVPSASGVPGADGAMSPAPSADAGEHIRIIEPAEWGPGGSRGISFPSRRGVRVVGYATHPNGVSSVEIDGRVAALTRDAGGRVRFTGYVAADSGSRDVLVMVHGTAGLPVVDRYRVAAGTAPGVYATPNEAWAADSGFHGKRWALVVGIGTYADTAISPLQFADDDARAFYQFLVSPQAGMGGFAPENVKLLVNEQATYAELRSALFGFLRQATEGDQVVIYFAGHGTPDRMRREDLYLLTHDSRASALSATALPMLDVNRAVEALYARHIVLITDACHSGGIGGGFAGGIGTGAAARGELNRINDAFMDQLGSSKGGLAVFAASQSSQSSFEDVRWGGGHGVFTHFLLEGLGGKADEDGDSIVTLVEAMHWTLEQVRRETSNAQIPAIGNYSYDPFLPMSLVLAPGEEGPPPVAAQAPAPPRIPPALADSLERARAAVAAFPGSSVYRYNLGRLLMRAGEHRDGVAALHESVRMSPENAAFRHALGQAYRETGAAQAAVDALMAASERDRQNAEYLYDLGLVLLEQGRSDDATGYLRRAIRAEPANASFHAALGRALWAGGRLRDAAGSLRRAVELDDVEAAYRRDLGMVLAADQQMDAALDELRGAVGLAPSEPRYMVELAGLLSAAGHADEARALMTDAVRLDSTRAEYRFGLGQLLRDAEMNYEALLELRAAVRLQPGHAGYRHAYGAFLGRANQPDSAVAQLRDAVRLAPDSAAFQSALGHALRRANLPGEALKALQEAALLDAGNAHYVYDLGLFYVEAGRYEEALVALQRATELAPDNRDYATEYRNQQRRARSRPTASQPAPR
jgi:tetratricopeptide (TPR) repeat protein